MTILEATPPKALFAPKINTQARGALDAHHQKVSQTQSRLEAARQPLLEHDAKIAGARADLTNAEAEREQAFVAQVAAVLENGPGAAVDHDETVNKAHQRVELLRRVLKTLEDRRPALEKAVHDVALSLNIERSAGELLVAQVVAEEADAVFKRMQEAKEAAAKAEASFHTLRAHLTSLKWLPLVEKMNIKDNTTPQPHWKDQQFPDWPKWVEALKSDARAQVVQP
jgi:hypothetical protein